jgi:hypothetical protein
MFVWQRGITYSPSPIDGSQLTGRERRFVVRYYWRTVIFVVLISRRFAYFTPPSVPNGRGGLAVHLLSVCWTCLLVPCLLGSVGLNYGGVCSLQMALEAVQYFHAWTAFQGLSQHLICIQQRQWHSPLGFKQESSGVRPSNGCRVDRKGRAAQNEPIKECSKCELKLESLRIHDNPLALIVLDSMVPLSFDRGHYAMKAIGPLVLHAVIWLERCWNAIYA